MKDSAGRDVAIHSFKFGQKEIDVSVQEKEMAYLKLEPPFIMVCNRFSEMFEDAILVSTLSKYFDDFRLITTNRKSTEYLNDPRIVCVKKSSFDTWRKNRKATIKYMQECLSKKISVVIFPGRRTKPYSIDNIAWDKDIVKAIYESGVPVITLGVGANGSLNNDNPENILRNLFSAFRSKKQLSIYLRAGKAISKEDLQNFKPPKQFRRFLFTKTHALGTSINVEKFFFKEADKKQKSVDEEVSQALLREEIERIEKDYLYAEKGAIKVFICPTMAIANVMKEISVLRELTYRSAGEGTGKSCDTDEYDLYYRQIFIWDTKKQRIAGGYRMGCGDEIMNRYGRSGFYIQSLFKLEKGIDPILNQSLEMGRSFVVKDYQKDAFPLFLLWKAIFIFLKRNQQYRYLTGPVSISAQYSMFSRQVIVAFLKEHFFDNRLSAYVTPRHPFREALGLKKKKVLLKQFDGMLNNLDKFIEDIEPGHFKIPVLIRQYIKQNSKFLGFNVDPEFSDALDCLILLDVKNLPGSTIENLG